MAAQFKKISIPASLYAKAEKYIKDTEFSSVESFIAHLLREKMSSEEDQEELSGEEKEKIKERLRSLGYIE